MIKMPKEIKEGLTEVSVRKFLCRKSLLLFSLYYMRDYWTHGLPKFHLTMYLQAMFSHGQRVLIWVMFRGSAKTALAKIKVVHAICYGYKKNIVWVGIDSEKAEDNIISISNQLQANPYIIRDFGQLFYGDMVMSRPKKSKKQRIRGFLTSNDVSVGLATVRGTLRGLTKDRYRPDLVIMDDFENEDTVTSRKRTRKTIRFIEGALGGRALNCHMIFLGNYISKEGVVQWLMDRAKLNTKTWTMYKVELYMKNPKTQKKELVWPERFVWTDSEAWKVNQNLQRVGKPEEGVDSVETLISESGTELFNEDFLNIPRTKKGTIVKRDWIQHYRMQDLKLDDKGEWWYRFPDDPEWTKATETVAYMDPSISMSETADPRAMLTMARFEKTVILPEGRKLEYRRNLAIRGSAGIWTLDETARRLADLRDATHPRRIGVENVGVQGVFRNVFDLYAITTEPVEPKGDKVTRMYESQADLEFGRDQFPDDGSLKDFEDQLCSFTGDPDEHDDMVDVFNGCKAMMQVRRAYATARAVG